MSWDAVTAELSFRDAASEPALAGEGVAGPESMHTAFPIGSVVMDSGLARLALRARRAPRNDGRGIAP